jgi:hypothetical protein
MITLTQFNLPLSSQYTLLKRQLSAGEPLVLGKDDRLKLLVLILKATVQILTSENGIHDWNYVDWLA